jgi:S-formylglutathione hydrolase
MKAARGLLVLSLGAGLIFSQPSAPKGSVERIKVHGKALEGNLEGDSPDRDVSIYLPPSYQTARNRRYPVVYMLHGFTDSDEKWFVTPNHWINFPAVLDKALAGGSREMIIVMPNAFTRFQGSMYSNSATTGNRDEFVARELVAYIDSHYRTVANAASRGLAGHSMGGYGTIRIGMQHPDVFSSIYALSPCCLAPNDAFFQGRGANPRAEAVHSFEEVDKADFGTKAALASSAAWSPNPKNPPLYLDLPYQDGVIRPEIAAKWMANTPLAMLEQYIPNIKKLHAIAFDAGAQDAGIAATVKTLDAILIRYDIPHTFEIYEGTHTSHVADRIEAKTMPFFSKNLQ